jgi:hypothetical protein
MRDIATELRERSLRAEQEGEPLALLDEAADEIDRLRRLRLTSAERTIIKWAAASLPPGCQATLRELLERTK